MKALYSMIHGCILNDNALRFIHQEKRYMEKQQAALLQNLESKGVHTKELAEKIMVTDKAISRWETGKGLPDTSLLKPLGDIFRRVGW